ncbi:hypothetical protein CcaverHIS002_0113460 [Cutaneotrichosporon cavernicola]|uniref:Putative peptidase domain-containing protein n=1 Tax=Cutaneotrichosporon cavernicola TaxID=279322 RepID=A0AA48I6A2_9TREE|nr:uncharacterized protein CcaverHIS019_0113330 [Cutaneotrichosporon cavernicola]BEI80817.1 hypothetical protein CcaverHIS002_0113460 [Cutaneotrichosporon cavernicola]BEI88615.1 hypothetical protein CcaverHIS019_0113330 [Cutaneotrichosporon cavernicola]BEI96388.1 hypothetical protein CcaverHIS631_0113370 [Cutaneotrichosporon cavernicola]BEJ04160.1 hypothetical protein CcaverHIS641_0113350 [Cutaneotrichosporon cavernicola]
MFNFLFTISAATAALGAPLERLARRDMKSFVEDIAIHESCTPPQHRMIGQGLKEALEVAAFAKDYIATNGPSDPVFKLYFGEKKEAYPAAMGAYDVLLDSNKDGLLFRCDDPDGNCHQPGWRGHWRGDNATLETVICPASYTDRLYNAAFCMNGFVLAEDKPSTYWSIDLIHRLYHVIGDGAIAHYAESLGDVVQLARDNSTYSPVDTDAVQYFAAHVYALEVAQGGDACIGDIAGKANEVPSSKEDAPSASVPPASTSESSTTTPDPATSTGSVGGQAAGNDCHTHADGSVHCGAE